MIRHAVCRFMREENGTEGAALVEFTIFAPLLVIMSIYTMDFGLLFFNKLAMQNAAQAGAHWALSNRVYNNNEILNAGENATGLSASQITVASTEFCGCPTTTGVTLQNGNSPPNPCASPTPTPAICSGGATCSGGALAGNYVAVCAKPTTAYQSFVPYGLAASSPSVNATAIVRIQ